jgi:cobalt-zinc-cadmium efflux system outer membrane protein
MIRSSFVCSIVVAACAAASAAAQDGARPASQSPPGSALTIDQAVQEAVEHNLNLQTERLNVPVAGAAVTTAALRPNPVVTFSLFRPTQGLVNAGISPDEQVLRTDYLVERGKKRERRVDEANLSKSMAEAQVSNATRSLILDVQNACIDVQLAQLNLALARDNLQAFESVVQVNTDRVRAGDLSQVELSRSRLAALQFQNDVRQRDTRLRIARNHLSTLLGRGTDGTAIEVVGELGPASPGVDYDALRRRALETRPDLLAARIDQARSTADLRLQLANRTVDYTVSGEYHRQEGAETTGSTVGLFFSVPLPLFNRNQGEIARAKVQQQQAATRTAALEHDVANEVANAYAAHTTARAIVETVEQQMLAEARDVRTTTEYAYRRGDASFVEFLDAVRAFNDTMQSYNEARADYARSLFTLESLAGKVNP